MHLLPNIKNIYARVLCGLSLSLFNLYPNLSGDLKLFKYTQSAIESSQPISHSSLSLVLTAVLYSKYPQVLFPKQLISSFLSSLKFKRTLKYFLHLSLHPFHSSSFFTFFSVLLISSLSFLDMFFSSFGSLPNFLFPHSILFLLLFIYPFASL